MIMNAALRNIEKRGANKKENDVYEYEQKH